MLPLLKKETYEGNAAGIRWTHAELEHPRLGKGLYGRIGRLSMCQVDETRHYAPSKILSRPK